MERPAPIMCPGRFQKITGLTDAQCSFSFHGVALSFLREDTLQQGRQGDSTVRRTRLANHRGAGAAQVP